MNTRIDISIKTILFAVGLVALIWLLLQISDILFLLFIAFLLMTAIHPLITYLEKIHIPRAIGILLVYVVLFGFIGVTVVSAIPALIVQFGKLIAELPSVVSKLVPYGNFDVSSVTQQIAPIGESIVRVTLGIFSNVVTVLTVFVFTFYFLLERRHAEDIMVGVLGETLARSTMIVLRRIERRLGAWVRGELILMTAIGIMVFIGLTILRIDFALPLAILAGFLELVPMMGPVLSAVPTVLIAFATSPLLALSVIALYIIVQQLENNIFVPIIMRKSVGFPPIVTILALLIGGRLAGIVGAVLAVPIALVLQEVLMFILTKHGSAIAKHVTKNPSKI